MVNCCSICNRRILRHSHHLVCSVCNNNCHIACLSNISTNDSIYLERENNKWMCPECSFVNLPFIHLENDEFLTAITELQITSSNLPFERLLQYQLNPFELNDDNSHNPIFDTDPDLQYFNDTTYINTFMNCEYFLEQSFIKKCKDYDMSVSTFSLIHLNIRSFSKNISEFESYLSTINYNFSFIGLTETWLTMNNAHLYDLKGYSHIYQCREGKKGGGVSLFVTNDLNFHVREDLSVMDLHIEALFIEVSKDFNNLNKGYLIGIVYRPPNTDVITFNNSMSLILQKLNTRGTNIYIMGDFNINLVDMKQHLPSEEFLENFYSFGLFPLINKPTRVTQDTATLIDNIFTNVISDTNVLNGIFYTNITDHFPVFTINCCQVLKPLILHRKVRSYSSKNIESFHQKLKHYSWDDVTDVSDGKSAFDLFYKNFCEIYDNCFPLKNVRQGYKHKHQWITEGLKKSIQIKNKLYIRSIKSNTLENICNYKSYKQNLQRLLRIAERKYYEELLNRNKSNLKKLWAIIKDVINKKRTSTVPREFIISGKTVTDQNEISTRFNKYFVNVGKQLADSIVPCDHDPLSFLKRSIPESIFLIPVSEAEIEKVIISLKDASPGWDGIHSKIIKATYKTYLKPLTHVMNLSITQGFFPNQMKIARVIPLHKSGDLKNLSNYRPVSILPLFSKILERLMYDRLLSFINKHNILYKFQFGFRNNHSTNMALIVLIDKIVSAIDKGEIVVGIFLDLKKAFDTVNHSILLRKLMKYGIRGNAYKWLQDYLNDRKQFVLFDNSESMCEKICCGVPQGSILGPLLFLIYINDMAYISEKILPIIFADDTNIFLSGKDINDTIVSFNQELEKIVMWLNANQLSLNIVKTHYMIFKSTRKKIDQNIDLTLDGHSLEKVDNTKFIGVILDPTITWGPHIKSIRSKVARGLGIIIKAKKVFSIRTLITLYNSFIYPHFIYCIEVWGNAANTHRMSLFKLQKKVIRIIKSAPFLANTEPLFKELKLLPLHNIYKHRLNIFMFKFMRNMLPDIMNELFSKNNELDRRSTRQNYKLRIPLCKTTLFQNTIRYQGVKEWNSISEVIEYKCSIHTFKYKLKHHYLQL